MLSTVIISEEVVWHRGARTCKPVMPATRRTSPSSSSRNAVAERLRYSSPEDFCLPLSWATGRS